MYAIVIRMFDLDFDNNLWQAISMASWTNKLKLQDVFITLSKISIGGEQNGPIFIGRSCMQEVAKKWNDPNDDEYELRILKDDVNQYALVRHK
jgi:hypothetical protein